jgi:2-oxoglutarate ferredoxin oxidoreductase subunit beta
MTKLYNENSVIKNNVHPDETVIEEGKKMVLGKFVDIQRPTFLEMLPDMSNAGGTIWPDKGIVTESRDG